MKAFTLLAKKMKKGNLRLTILLILIISLTLISLLGLPLSTMFSQEKKPSVIPIPSKESTYLIGSKAGNNLHPSSATRLVAGGEIAQLSSSFEIPSDVVKQATNIFKSVLNKQRGMIGQSKLFVIYEPIFYENGSAKENKIIAAEMISRGVTYRAILHTAKSGVEVYLTPAGRTLDSEFLKLPLKSFKKISSNFSASRNHPILGEIRMHKGIDYSARLGTEVRAVEDGKVKAKGYSNSFGNIIYLTHAYNRETRYGHLLKFPPNLKVGDSVKRGQLIGYVGMTGLATAPHLHFEFLEGGTHMDPRKLLNNGYALGKSERKNFDEYSDEYISVLEAFKKIQKL